MTNDLRQRNQLSVAGSLQLGEQPGQIGGATHLMPSGNQIEVVKTNANTIVDRERKFLAKLFGTKDANAHVAHELQMAATEREFRHRALVMIRDVQLQTLRETYAPHLQGLKVKGRSDVAILVTQKLNELSIAISQQTDRMIAYMEERFDRLELIRNPAIKAKEKARIESELEGYFSTTEKLHADFRNIVNEQIKS